MSSGLFTLQTSNIYEGVSIQTITVSRPAGFSSSNIPYTLRYNDGSNTIATSSSISGGNTISFIAPVNNIPPVGSWDVRVYNVLNQYYTSAGSVQLTVNDVTFTFSPSSLTAATEGTLTATVNYADTYSTWPSGYDYELQYYNVDTWTELKTITNNSNVSNLDFTIAAGQMPAEGLWSLQIVQLSGENTIATYSVDGGTQLIVNAATAAMCFAPGSLILTSDGQVPVENLKEGLSLVKTVSGGYRRVTRVKQMPFYNPEGDAKRVKQRLYVCDSEGYADINSGEQLILTGAHSVLVSSLTDSERADVIADLGEVFLTDGRYRLPVFIDVRARPYLTAGNFTVYHFALEDEWEHANHGVYANGLLVESASNWHLRETD